MDAQEDAQEDGRRAASDGTTTGDLLSRAKHGDHEAERRVFGEHIERLRARARRHPRSRALRAHVTEDDLVADVFVRALSSGLLDRFDDRGKGSLERLLAAVLDNVIKDALRRTRTRKRTADRPVFSMSALDPGLETATPACQQPSPTSLARVEELLARARDLLDEYSWQVWSAVEVGGVEPVEVARRLGITPSAARGVLSRARKRVFADLERTLRRGAS